MKYNGYRNFPQSLRAGAGVVAVMAACLGGASHAFAAGNDNFADAIVLTGEFGTTNAATTGYTTEFGEPSHAGIVPHSTAWFK